MILGPPKLHFSWRAAFARLASLSARTRPQNEQVQIAHVVTRLTSTHLAILEIFEEIMRRKKSQDLADTRSVRSAVARGSPLNPKSEDGVSNVGQPIETTEADCS
jgi:hypothetical protein